MLLHKVCFVAVYAVGDELVACPARCTCNGLQSYTDGIIVKCSYLDLSDISLSLPISVQTLDLSHNAIRTLKNDSFSNYLRLSTIILSHNKLEDIELNAFSGLQMLTDIDLSYNNLKTIHPQIFSSSSKLEYLSLSSNPLVNIPSQSPILVSDTICSLDLSSCSLTAIDTITFSRLPRLYSLDLSSNRLSAVSVTTLENLTELRILELANNRWTCNCSVVELMQWAQKRRGHLPAHKPLKCLEGGKYSTLWTAVGRDTSCKESVTPVPHIREAATDMTTALRRIPFTQRTATYLYSSQDLATETVVTSWAEPMATPETETGDWDALFPWNANTVLVYLILPCTLGVAVFLALTAVDYITQTWLVRRPRHVIQAKDNSLSAFLSLDNQVTANFTKHHAGCKNINRQGTPYDTYHVYEEIA
jgi:hypothetical protein